MGTRAVAGAPAATAALDVALAAGLPSSPGDSAGGGGGGTGMRLGAGTGRCASCSCCSLTLPAPSICTWRAGMAALGGDALHS